MSCILGLTTELLFAESTIVLTALCGGISGDAIWSGCGFSPQAQIKLLMVSIFPHVVGLVVKAFMQNPCRP